MNKRLLFLVSALGLMALLATACAGPAAAPVTGPGPTATSGAREVTVFQSPDCECCGNYQAILRQAGFRVETRYVQDMSPIKEQFQIPRDMQSCHTAVIGEYFVEGHVPIEAVDKLLAEKPDIGGIALPGMPSGAPGMPGSQQEPFVIFALSDGEPSPFMTY